MSADPWLQEILDSVNPRSPIDRNARGGGGSGDGPPFDTAGSPADDGGMEARIDLLEERLTRVEVKLDHVAHDVGQFKWFLLGGVLTMIVTVIGTSIGIQQMTVSTFQAAAEATAKATADLSVRPQQPTIIVVPGAVAPPSPAASR